MKLCSVYHDPAYAEIVSELTEKQHRPGWSPRALPTPDSAHMLHCRRG